MIGIYVLLSTLALGGLLITLTERLRSNSRNTLEAESRETLTALNEMLKESDLPATALVKDWGPLLSRRGQLLAIVSAPGQSVASTFEQQLGGAAMQTSIARRARADGFSMMWPPTSPTTLVSAMTMIPGSDDTPVLVLQSDVAGRLAAAEAVANSARRAAIVAWLCGTACLAFVASAFVGPLRTLVTAMTTSESSVERNDLLLRLSDRPDEFGQIARSLRTVDVDRLSKLGDLQKSEARIRALANRLSTVLQSMKEGVVAVDANERILFANDVARRIMGLDTSNVEGRLICEAIRSPHVQETVREAMLADETATLEFKMPRGDLVLSMVATPIRGEGTSGAVLVLHDVSEIRRLESMRRDFVSGVSHELKTPLTVIQACTETLLDGALDDKEAAHRFLKQIEEQAGRLLQLILGMLQLARVESGEQAFKREPIAVHEIAEQLVQSLQPVAAGRNIQLSVCGEQEMFVLADYQALRTVISNLVDNGIKYTPEGGWVKLELTAEEDSNVIRVKDNGMGIPEKHRARVFERFYRVERDRNRERGGTGLGLAIVKHLCSTMGAELRLESRFGHGTTVTVRFLIEDE